ncbi:GbsR/MarR family transcriptional regulator [Maribellus maritimus]|uniref:GbsR/MarR family transcriptional regulator n=1 Tax=Maribellus maritimus TaxID=2870838 RepID=UPI001EEA54F2|nr:helix-turn-helix domain-containing protein [Maribellus maritimus]MCG6190385.1 MarR family transcriptional regulator [Maribellus maritimus]
MEEPERLQKQKELVECIGRLHEKDGFQPVTARIMGLLMVMDKEEYTFDEIVQEMKISKSSASTALKNLEIRGVIEYVTYPGDRKRYFRFVSGDINEMIDGIEKKMKLQLDVIEQALELKKNPDSRNAKFLENVKEGIHFFIKNMRKLKAEYSKEH